MEKIINAQTDYLNVLIENYETALQSNPDDYVKALRAIASFAKSSADIVDSYCCSNSATKQPKIKQVVSNFASAFNTHQPPINQTQESIQNQQPQNQTVYGWQDTGESNIGIDPKTARSTPARQAREERDVTIPPMNNMQQQYPHINGVPNNGYYYP